MAPFTGEPSHAQQVALAIMPKIAGSCSVLGSIYIIYDILRQHRGRHQTGYHRIMVGLSVVDILMSLGFVLSTWPMPVDTQYVWGAVGNTATCDAVGFLLQAGVSTVLYSGSLSTYYLLKIRYGWTETHLNQKEFWFHAVPLVWGLATMIAGIPLKLYNSGIFDCWIAPYPLNCQESRTHPDTSDPSYIPCERGDNASIYQWALHLGPSFASIFLITFNMFLTYLFVRQQEIRTLKYSATKDDQTLVLSQRMARQSYLYVGALYITWTPVAVTRLTQVITGHTYYWMLLVIAITIPLQGCWNVLVYVRPRYIEAQEKKRKEQMAQGRARQAMATAKSSISSSYVVGDHPSGAMAMAREVRSVHFQESADGDNNVIMEEPELEEREDDNYAIIQNEITHDDSASSSKHAAASGISPSVEIAKAILQDGVEDSETFNDEPEPEKDETDDNTHDQPELPSQQEDGINLQHGMFTDEPSKLGEDKDENDDNLQDRIDASRRNASIGASISSASALDDGDGDNSSENAAGNESLFTGEKVDPHHSGPSVGSDDIIKMEPSSNTAVPDDPADMEAPAIATGIYSRLDEEKRHLPGRLPLLDESEKTEFFDCIDDVDQYVDEDPPSNDGVASQVLRLLYSITARFPLRQQQDPQPPPPRKDFQNYWRNRGVVNMDFASEALESF